MGEEVIQSIRLTEYSHGAGCGCKISPQVLAEILQSQESSPYQNLLVGNANRDDAAVLDLGNGQALISTTDFFMPIVDDPFDFGRIAAANAISDVYAMGGKPVLAIAILGWPIDKLSAEIANKVVSGGRNICELAGIPLGGGHSIDTTEPIFGLAVNGIVPIQSIKKNSTAQPGDLLFLSKPLGIGIISTAAKKNLANQQDVEQSIQLMTSLNTLGLHLSIIEGLNAMTDVTGFGLMGHLLEMCQGSSVSAVLYEDKIPIIQAAKKYEQLGCIPGGTGRNFESYGHHLPNLTNEQMHLFCDPQTSGGLLFSVHPDTQSQVESILEKYGMIEDIHPIGVIREPADPIVQII